MHRKERNPEIGYINITLNIIVRYLYLRVANTQCEEGLTPWDGANTWPPCGGLETGSGPCAPGPEVWLNQS